MKVCADLCNVSIGSAWNAIHQMIKKICQLRSQLIEFLHQKEFEHVARMFQRPRNFPNIIRCIDGTHVPVFVVQSDTRETFRNRKTFLSLNVQIICGHDSRIYDIVSSWPGSAHDSNIFAQSDIARRFEEGEFGQYHLLGDSAYRLSQHMMTPFKNPSSRIEGNFF